MLPQLQPYRALENHIPDEVAKLDWDQYQAINYRDVATFLGASYFRAVGSDWQYGLSARGLAIDCGMQQAEEFPNFIKKLTRVETPSFRAA